MNKKSHPPCPHGFFFSTSSLPQNFPPSYLPPTNPTPLHSIARAPKTSSGCGMGAGAAGARPVGVGAGPTRSRKCKMLTFFFCFFLFFLFEVDLRSLLLLPFSLLHYSLTTAQQRRRPSSFFSFFVALQLNCNAAKKKAFFFFLFLYCTTSLIINYGMSNIGIESPIKQVGQNSWWMFWIFMNVE
jgi:hypothetical protein